jgi:hypothetical protein
VLGQAGGMESFAPVEARSFLRPRGNLLHLLAHFCKAQLGAQQGKLRIEQAEIGSLRPFSTLSQDRLQNDPNRLFSIPARYRL